MKEIPRNDVDELRRDADEGVNYVAVDLESDWVLGSEDVNSAGLAVENCCEEEKAEVYKDDEEVETEVVHEERSVGVSGGFGFCESKGTIRCSDHKCECCEQ